MNQDLTLLLAIEQFLQEKMINHHGIRVARDMDLAELFDLDVEELREKVREHSDRFPADFIVQSGVGEYAFSELGIIVLGGLLKSERAIEVHIQFIEYFVHLAHNSGVSIFDLIIRPNEL